MVVMTLALLWSLKQACCVVRLLTLPPSFPPADGVAYANKDLKCTTILDMATLTGAQVRREAAGPARRAPVRSSSNVWSRERVVSRSHWRNAPVPDGCPGNAKKRETAAVKWGFGNWLKNQINWGNVVEGGICH